MYNRVENSKRKGFQVVLVSTGLMEFFIPTKKMYIGVGFKEICCEQFYKLQNCMTILIMKSLYEKVVGKGNSRTIKFKAGN
jgi:hypothetical protein